MTSKKGDHGPIFFRLIPRRELPKRITGRPQKRRDPFDFKGRFSIDILKIRLKGEKYITRRPRK